MPSASRCTAPASGWTGMSTRSCVTSGRPPGRLDNVARHGDRDLAGRGRRRAGRVEASVGMARNAWFETVAEAERRAKRQLPKSVCSALLAGCEAGVTYRDNLHAFTELGFAPHVGGLFAQRETATSVMGQPVSMPVLLSPTGVQAVHPDGELAVARAGAARGVAMGLSSFASKPIEDVVAANPQTMFQVYWNGTREQITRRLDRARRAGAVGLILTLDWSFSHGRDWGSPRIPDRMSAREVLRFAPEVVTRPAYLLRYLRSDTRVPDLTVPNLAEPGQPA